MGWIEVARESATERSLHLSEVVCLAGDEEADDQTEKPDDGAEDFNDENFDEAAPVS